MRSADKACMVVRVMLARLRNNRQRHKPEQKYGKIDAQLYAKYNLSDEGIVFIEFMIKSNVGNNNYGKRQCNFDTSYRW